MRLWASSIRTLRVIGISSVILLLLCVGFVQFQQHLLRHRAERLLADFQSIRLHQSTWADAQVLMTRWGKWGHYDGTCTASDCEYTITLSDPVSKLRPSTDAGWRMVSRVVRIYMFLRGNPSTMLVRFKVQNGIVWRSGVWLNITVPPNAEKDDEYGYSLLLSARASDSLHAKPHGPWVLGNDDQLAEHPYYKEGSPSGCEGCESDDVTFTPYLSPAELKRLSSYELSCITRFHRCLNLPDVLPAARDWNLHTYTGPNFPEPLPSTTQRPCAIPVFARARDADSILSVDVLSTRITKSPDENDSAKVQEIQTAKVRLVQALKGTSPLAPGSLLEVVPWFGGDYYDTWKAPEYLEPGKRYVIFPYQDDVPPKMSTDFCGVLEVTPLIRQQINQGMAQNDLLRQVEHDDHLTW